MTAEQRRRLEEERRLEAKLRAGAALGTARAAALDPEAKAYLAQLHQASPEEKQGWR